MLEHEMTVQQNGLNFGEERVIAVDVSPAGLHHTDLGIGEMMNYPLQKILGGHKIRVENGYKLTSRGLETLCQSTRFEALAIRTMVIADRESPGSIVIDQSACHGNRFIGRVVEHLNVQFFRRIFQAADRVQQALDHELFVEDWKLNGDTRQVGKMCGRICGPIFLVLVIEINQNITMSAI